MNMTLRINTHSVHSTVKGKFWVFFLGEVLAWRRRFITLLTHHFTHRPMLLGSPVTSGCVTACPKRKGGIQKAHPSRADTSERSFWTVLFFSLGGLQLRSPDDQKRLSKMPWLRSTALQTVHVGSFETLPVSRSKDTTDGLRTSFSLSISNPVWTNQQSYTILYMEGSCVFF